MRLNVILDEKCTLWLEKQALAIRRTSGAAASGPTRRRPYAGSFGRSRPGFGLEEVGLVRPTIIHRDLFGVERPMIGDGRFVV